MRVETLNMLLFSYYDIFFWEFIYDYLDILFRYWASVVNHPNSNNLAFTDKKLNLHNDMPQYQEIPGVSIILTRSF